MEVTTHTLWQIGQRDENQDRFVELRSADGRESLLLVADGLGGHTGGAQAAETVIQTARDLWSSRDRARSDEDFLRKLVKTSHNAINDVAERSKLDPRSTIVALYIRDSGITSIHAGDSRVIQINESGSITRTIDHSIGQLNVLRGVIKEEELATHPDQNKLFAHLGGREQPEFDIMKWDLSDGNKFVVCSDGFWEIFSNEEMKALFDVPDTSAKIERAYSEKLKALTKHDNTTAIFAVLNRGFNPVWYWLALALLVLAGYFTVRSRPPTRTSEDQSGSRSREVFSSLNAGLDTPSASSLPYSFSFDAPRSASASTEEALLAQAREGKTGPNRSRRHEGGAPFNAPENESGIEANSSNGNGEGGTEFQESGQESRAVPVERVDLEPNRTLDPNGSLAESVEDELRKVGKIGLHDSLEQRGEGSRIGESETSRLSHNHKGIPVFASEVVTTVKNGRIVQISGHVADVPEIETTPANDYPTTLRLAVEASGIPIEALDEGSLVVFRKTDGTSIVAWKGSVIHGEEPAQCVFDPSTGEIVLITPSSTREA